MDDVEAHLSRVMAQLKKGLVVPFLGAGANVWDRAIGYTWNAHERTALPSGDDLAQLLAGEYLGLVQGPFRLERVALDVSIDPGEDALNDTLRLVFDADYPPSRLHVLLARIPSALQEKGWAPLDLVVTTNYDDCLERAFAGAGHEYHVLTYVVRGNDKGYFRHHRPDGEVVTVSQPETYLLPADDDGRLEPTILKLHGTVDRKLKARDSFVITEDHYIEYLALGDVAARLPRNVKDRLANSHFLFLGYGLLDWNVRALLHRLWEAQKADRTSWAIQFGVDPFDVQVWGTRRVKILDVGLDRYVDALEEAIDELPVNPYRVA